MRGGRYLIPNGTRSSHIETTNVLMERSYDPRLLRGTTSHPPLPVLEINVDTRLGPYPNWTWRTPFPKIPDDVTRGVGGWATVDGAKISIESQRWFNENPDVVQPRLVSSSVFTPRNPY